MEDTGIPPLLKSDIEDMVKRPAQSEVLREWLFVRKLKGHPTCYQSFKNMFVHNLARQFSKNEPLRNLDNELETNKMLLRCAITMERRISLREKVHQQLLDRERLATKLSSEPNLPLITREMNQFIVSTVERGLKKAVGVVDHHGAPLLSGSVVLARMPDKSLEIGIYEDSNGVTQPNFVPKDGDGSQRLDSSTELTLLSEQPEHLELALFSNLDWLADPQKRASVLKELEHVKAIAHAQMDFTEESETVDEREESALMHVGSTQPFVKRRRAKPVVRLGSNPFSLKKRIKEGRFV